MKIPVAEKIGLDSVALDGHQGLETIPNKPSITFSGSLMIQVESKHRSCQLKTFRPKTECSSFHVGVDDIGGPHPRHKRSRKAAASSPHGGCRIGVQQPVMGVKADQRAQGGEVHLTVGHAAGGAFLPVPESRFQLRGELLNPAINAGMSTSTPRSASISSKVPVAQWLRQVPTDTGQDDVWFETVAFEVDHAGSQREDGVGAWLTEIAPSQLTQQNPKEYPPPGGGRCEWERERSGPENRTAIFGYGAVHFTQALFPTADIVLHGTQGEELTGDVIAEGT